MHSVYEIRYNRGMISSIPASLNRYFWDTRPENIDVQKNASYVIDRLLSKGDLNSWEWMRTAYSSEQIKDRVQKSRQLSRKDTVFFSLVYNLPPNKQNAH